MNYLVGDIGNTLTKIALINSNFKIKKFYNIETKKLIILKNRINFLKKFKSDRKSTRLNSSHGYISYAVFCLKKKKKKNK